MPACLQALLVFIYNQLKQSQSEASTLVERSNANSHVKSLLQCELANANVQVCESFRFLAALGLSSP